MIIAWRIWILGILVLRHGVAGIPNQPKRKLFRCLQQHSVHLLARWLRHASDATGRAMDKAGARSIGAGRPVRQRRQRHNTGLLRRGRAHCHPSLLSRIPALRVRHKNVGNHHTAGPSDAEPRKPRDRLSRGIFADSDVRRIARPEQQQPLITNISPLHNAAVHGSLLRLNCPSTLLSHADAVECQPRNNGWRFEDKHGIISLRARRVVGPGDEPAGTRDGPDRAVLLDADGQ